MQRATDIEESRGGGGRRVSMSHKSGLVEVMILEMLFLESPSILSYFPHLALSVCAREKEHMKVVS